jgi:hypothetical protein
VHVVSVVGRSRAWDLTAIPTTGGQVRSGAARRFQHESQHHIGGGRTLIKEKPPAPSVRRWAAKGTDFVNRE